MPKFLEDRLRAEAAAKGFTGRHADAYVYGALNNLGAMKGNQETAKGAKMQGKHNRDVTQGRASNSGHPGRNLGKHLRPKKGS